MGETKKSYKDLKIWQKVGLVFDMVCDDVAEWPSNRIANSIVFQLLDSTGSISANIAEGYGRGSPGEFEQFLRYARGSMAESDDWLYKALKRSIITEKRYDEYKVVFTELSKMIASFIWRLRSQSKRKSR